jgi:hypothetical protein
MAFRPNPTLRQPIPDRRPLHRRIYIENFPEPNVHHPIYDGQRIFTRPYTESAESIPILVQTAGLLYQMQARQRSVRLWNASIVMFSIHIGLQRTPRGYNDIEARRRARGSAARDGGSICWTTPGPLHARVPHWAATPKSTVC